MGRPKGAKNKHSFNAEEIAQKFNVEPLEILMRFAMGDWEWLGYDSSVEVNESAKGGTFIKHTITPELRAKCAQEAAKYLYSQKQSIQHSTGDEGFKIIVEKYQPKDK